MINKNYLILHLGYFIFSLGFIASKLCSQEEFLSFNYLLFLGLDFLSLVIYFFIWQKVLKHIPLSLAYAHKGVVIMWGMLFGYLFFSEGISISNLCGAIIIAIGIVFVSKGAKNE